MSSRHSKSARPETIVFALFLQKQNIEAIFVLLKYFYIRVYIRYEQFQTIAN